MSGLEEKSSEVTSGLEELPSDVISGIEDISLSLDDVSGPEEKPPVSDSPSDILVAAIDFGTTYSGYAFKMKHEGPKHMYIKSWNSDGGSSCLPSEKAPTCVLLTADGDFKSFGYEAEREYCDSDDHTEWRFFKHFKMILHREEGLNNETTIKDTEGVEISAKKIFTHCIKYMKDDLLKMMKKKKVEAGFLEDNILWIITVPAIWEEPAKQFMRAAAEDAGIKGHNLKLALEPEAASIYVKEMDLEVHKDLNESHLSAFSPGTKYMIVDLGGGTVDVTVREVLSDRSLKEITKASGGAWGGLHVSEKFLQFIRDLVGNKLMDEFKKRYPVAYLELEREVERKKRNLKGDENMKITINLPAELLELFEEKKGKSLAEFVKSSGRYRDRIDVKNERLRFDMTTTFHMFKPAVDSILDHIEELVSDPITRGLRNIILVGGFSDCKIIQEAVKEKFKKFRVVIPQEAGLAVLKGAVLFGHNPLIVSERVSPFTYGTKQLRYFSEGDPVEYRVEIDGVPYCKNVFNVLARSGETFKLGQRVKTEVAPVHTKQTRMPVIFCQSNNPDQEYFDKNCREIGTLLVDMPDTTGGLDRTVDVSLAFGETELQVAGTDRSSKKNISVTIDLLKKR